jgi:hypothetical protein
MIAIPKRILIVLNLTLAALPLAASSSYVLEVAPGTNVSVLATKYHLTVVRSPPRFLCPLVT